MIVAGGSSLHKGTNSWQAARAISCLPALVGSYGKPGGGLGQRHGSTAFGAGLADLSAADRRPPGQSYPQQMSALMSALCDGELDVFLLAGCNMTSSFADSEKLEKGMAATGLVVCHDLFMSETARRYADIILPGTSWLEDYGAKRTHTHVYLLDKAVEPAGEARTIQDILRGLADHLGVEDFFPWSDQAAMIDAILDHPSTGHATVASMKANGGRAKLKISPVAYPNGDFPTPSGKIEFFSQQAEAEGLPPLPTYEAARNLDPSTDYPLTLAHGRTLTHFHSFYDQGRALPTLAERDPGPQVWLSTSDAQSRGVRDGANVKVFNGRGSFEAAAFVTDRIMPGAIWMHDGWVGLNAVTDSRAALPDGATTLFAFTVGQSSYEAFVDVAPL